MKILVAEDEDSIARMYQLALQSRGHEVTITSNGQDCWKEYLLRSGSKDPRPPFDVVILDYRMPELNGFQTAKRILKVQPKQRIIFASAFMKETLVDAINKFGVVAELLHKPIEVDHLIDSVEDTYLYSQLQRLKVDVGDIRSWNPSREQLSDLLDALLRLKDPEIVFTDLLASHDSSHGNTMSLADKKNDFASKGEFVQPSTGLTKGSEKKNAVALAIIEESLRFLGSEWMAILYYHLSKRGISKENIVHNPSAFLSELDKMLEGGSSLIKARILQVLETNKELIEVDESGRKFARTLKTEIQGSRGK